VIQKNETASKWLRIGFVPLCDSAPLVMARELGLFEKYGLQVQLKREIGWATLRDKILYGELEAAHALAPMVFAATLGWDAAPVSCLSGLVLNLHGNAITLSKSLLENRKSGGGLRENLFAGKDRLVLGIPFLYSSHHFIARTWLRGLGVQAERRTQFVVVPPPQMPQSLRAGHLDGYCVGEPWNSIAALGGFGRIAATSAEISAMHPEKVLMVRGDFAEQRAEEHQLLIAALIEACRFCDEPHNRDMIVATLARRQYLNAPTEALRMAFGGTCGDANGGSTLRDDFTIFARDNANEPSGQKAAWIFKNLRDSGLCPDPLALTFSLAKKVFRADLFEQALRLDTSTHKNPKHESETQHESVST
jgi:ABC-type nitrate/sulfonate/bicarbonate transport system substrate-binding protein